MKEGTDMRAAGNTHIGAVRKMNQDTCQCGEFPGGGAWAVVCDGMGGASSGDVASKSAQEHIIAYLTQHYREGLSAGSMKSLLLNALRTANDAVYKMSQEQPALRGMGTTAVVMAAVKGALHVVHVGDSRAYIYNKCGLSQITEDHSYVQDLVNFGEITREQARRHPRRNIITRVLGVHETVRPDYTSCPFLPGDKALACTDGLSNYMDDALMEEYLENAQDPQALADSLIRYALECGGADNITAALIFEDGAGGED